MARRTDAGRTGTGLGPDVLALIDHGGPEVVAVLGADGSPVAGRGWGIAVVDAAAGRLRLVVDAGLPVTPGPVAVTISNVQTFASRQVKGVVTEVGPATEDDFACMVDHIDLFFDAVSRSDPHPRELFERMVPHRVVGASVVVTSTFDQTPGPGAGQEVGSAAPVEPEPGDRHRRSPVRGGAAGEGAGGPAASGTELDVSVDELDACFHGAIPAVLATRSADGVPNVTYLSRAHRVDGERVALSNQFFSKSSANLAEDPRASLLLIDPTTFDEYRLTVVYERTDRRGVVFESLRADIETLAAIQGMQDVFRLRAADVFRVEAVERFVDRPPRVDAYEPRPVVPPTAVAELCGRIGRCDDLDAVVATTVDGLVELVGHHHVALLVVDESRDRLVTMASRGYEDEGVGSELAVGDGVAGLAAQRGTPVRIGNQVQMRRYSETVRQAYGGGDDVGPGREIPLPALPLAHSHLAVPALAMGRLVAVLQVEEARPVAFDDLDEANLQIVATLVAQAIESTRDDEPSPLAATPAPAVSPGDASSTALEVRFFPVDGSTFLDGDYLIKGVGGRLLWSLLRQHEEEGRTDFTNREVRLDPTLDLPDLRQNFESRLILLKRRLDERESPVRIEKTGRGRFRLVVAPGTRIHRRDMG